jgi:hypothetical protein
LKLPQHCRAVNVTAQWATFQFLNFRWNSRHNSSMELSRRFPKILTELAARNQNPPAKKMKQFSTNAVNYGRLKNSDLIILLNSGIFL